MIKRKIISFILFSFIFTTAVSQNPEQYKPTFQFNSSFHYVDTTCDTLWNSNSTYIGWTEKDDFYEVFFKNPPGPDLNSNIGNEGYGACFLKNHDLTPLITLIHHYALPQCTTHIRRTIIRSIKKLKTQKCMG